MTLRNILYFAMGIEVDTLDADKSLGSKASEATHGSPSQLTDDACLASARKQRLIDSLDGVFNTPVIGFWSLRWVMPLPRWIQTYATVLPF